VGFPYVQPHPATPNLANLQRSLPLLSLRSQTQGRCTQFARAHNSGVGVFFLVNKVQVLLISNKLCACNPNLPYTPHPHPRPQPTTNSPLRSRLAACYWRSLYLDANGEEDVGLRRGRPLTLNDQVLAELRDLYNSHGIVREVARTSPLYTLLSPPFTLLTPCFAGVRNNSERVIRQQWY
jgi:hypothetical protein